MAASLLAQDQPWVNLKRFKSAGDEKIPPKEKMCIISAYVNTCKEMYRYTHENKHQYAKKYGYEYHIFRGKSGWPLPGLMCHRPAHFLSMSVPAFLCVR